MRITSLDNSVHKLQLDTEITEQLFKYNGYQDHRKNKGRQRDFIIPVTQLSYGYKIVTQQNGKAMICQKTDHRHGYANNRCNYLVEIVQEKMPGNQVPKVSLTVGASFSRDNRLGKKLERKIGNNVSGNGRESHHKSH